TRTTSDFFGSDASMAALEVWRDPPGISPAYGAKTFVYPSFAAFEAADVPPGSVVMYDIEHWHLTPRPEQRDPQTYVPAFISLAHQRGLVVVVAPAAGLLNVRGARCARADGESMLRAFTRCDLTGLAARAGADWILLQAQSVECNPERYAEWIRAVS